VYLAFKYTADGANAEQWFIDDISVDASAGDSGSASDPVGDYLTARSLTSNDLGTDTNGNGFTVLEEYLVGFGDGSGTDSMAYAMDASNYAYTMVSDRATLPEGISVELMATSDLTSAFQVVTHSHSVVDNSDGTFTHSFTETPAPTATERFYMLRISTSSSDSGSGDSGSGDSGSGDSGSGDSGSSNSGSGDSGSSDTGSGDSGSSGLAVWINEIHYDDQGADSGEGVEIANPGGADLTGYTVVLYNGKGGASYGSAGQISGSATYISVSMSGMQNGSPDGVALVDASGTAVQFLSYEGSFTATDGPASGMTSVDIGVQESNSTTLEGQSMQLSGTGSSYADFTWQTPATSTFGSVNNGQTIN
jgi:hypothetical protein